MPPAIRIFNYGPGKYKHKIQGDDGIFRLEEMQMRGSSVRGERDSGGDRDNVPRRQPTMHLFGLLRKEFYLHYICTKVNLSCISETRTLYHAY